MADLKRSAKHSMSLFVYRGRLADGKEKSGKVTAKTESEARDRILAEQSVIEVLTIKAQPVSPAKPQSPSAKPKALTKLRKILYLQSGRCFFCGDELNEADASIEHLHPKAKGGASTEDNEVVCHATLNETFGSMDLKSKFAFVITNAGKLKCPRRT